MKKEYTVYGIVYNNKRRYVGLTNNLHRRELQHNRDFRNGKKKLIYDFLRDNSYLDKIILIPLYKFESRTEAKRMELYLILLDHFNNKLLKQNIPSIRDFG